MIAAFVICRVQFNAGRPTEAADKILVRFIKVATRSVLNVNLPIDFVLDYIKSAGST